MEQLAFELDGKIGVRRIQFFPMDPLAAAHQQRVDKNTVQVQVGVAVDLDAERCAMVAAARRRGGSPRGPDHANTAPREINQLAVDSFHGIQSITRVFEAETRNRLNSLPVSLFCMS